MKNHRCFPFVIVILALGSMSQFNLVHAESPCVIKAVESWENVPSCIYPSSPTNTDPNSVCYTSFVENRRTWETNCKYYWEQKKSTSTPNPMPIPTSIPIPTNTPLPQIDNYSIDLINRIRIPSSTELPTPTASPTATLIPSPTVTSTILETDTKNLNFFQRFIAAVKILFNWH